MNSKLLGGILLVVGTTIGAGMLALPIATAQAGFWGSLILLIACWGVMTACAFLFLEVNLWLPPNSNLVSMAGATLGWPGQVVAWSAYLLLLYSILSAYVGGGGDLFHYLLNTSGITISLSTASILFTLIFGVVVYWGTRSVDYVNRFLMLGKMGAFAILIFMIIPYVSKSNLLSGEFKNVLSPTSLKVTTVSFTCAMIIPSLRTYFGEDVKALRKAILIGTVIPLVCYIAWDMVIMGVIPLEGPHGLKTMIDSPSSNSDMVIALTNILNSQSLTMLTKFFTSICMATSFLSVSLSLSDFLSDGLKMQKKGAAGGFIFAATFLPPVGMVLFYPDAFIRGLNYAGICCFILMVLMPPLMAWRCRYHHEANNHHQVRGGKFLLSLLVIFATLMLGFGIQGAV